VKRVEDLRSGELKVVKESALRRISTNYVYIGTVRLEFGVERLRARGGRVSPAMREEGYFLDVNADGIVILVESPRGRFYGTITLLQIIERPRRSVSIPAVSIHDWFAQKIHGITDDINRDQISTLDNFKKIIRFLSRYKLNTYALYEIFKSYTRMVHSCRVAHRKALPVFSLLQRREKITFRKKQAGTLKI